MTTPRPALVIARSVGILCLAAGFILGMHGLDQPDSGWLPTALGLIVTGLIAQTWALIQSIIHRIHPKEEKKK